MADAKIRHFVTKPGASGPRYYWQPSGVLRTLGLRPVRLPDDLDAAKIRAEWLNEEADRKRAEVLRAPGAASAEGGELPVTKHWGHGVYVFGFSAEGPLKVGHSNNPIARLREVQTGNPHRLYLLGWVATRTKTEAALVEAGTHERLRAYRMKGEWFRCGVPQALAAIVAAAFGPKLDTRTWTRPTLVSDIPD